MHLQFPEQNDLRIAEPKKEHEPLNLLLSPVPSNLELVGVSGDSIRANVMGHLFVALRDPTTGCIYHVDFGIAHDLDGCPLNILSLPLLYQSGAIAHF